MVVGILQAALFRPGDGGSQGGQKDDVIRVLLEDVLGAFLYEACHDEWKR